MSYPRHASLEHIVETWSPLVGELVALNNQLPCPEKARRGSVGNEDLARLMGIFGDNQELGRWTRGNAIKVAFS